MLIVLFHRSELAKTLLLLLFFSVENFFSSYSLVFFRGKRFDNFSKLVK